MQKTWTSDFDHFIHMRPQGHVLAVCLHPALDVTIYTKNGKEISRTQTLGGKAINLARMLHALGARVTLLAHSSAYSALRTVIETIVCSEPFKLTFLFEIIYPMVLSGFALSP